MTHTDLIIIGAGPGGYRAASFAAGRGLSVAIFESGHVGGTCLNVGCIPTKALARNAEIAETLGEAETFGLRGQGFDIDFGRVIDRKDQVVAQLRSGVETLLARPGIALVRAEARFIDSHTVEADGRQYTAPHIIVATGSVPKTLSLGSPAGRRVLQSSDLLQATTLPRSLCIVGAGVIGMEFASIFNAFGTEVTVVEYMKECLPALDSDIAKRLRKLMEKRGVRFCMQCAVTAVTAQGIEFEDKKGVGHTVCADEVLMAVGRAPRVADHFARAGFSYDERRGIAVDEHMQTTVPGIYAIGDVNGRQMLAHAAEMQALHVVNRITGRDDDIRLDIMPTAIFTHPEAACVGKSEDLLKAEGTPYQCHKAFYRANGKALAMGQPEGMLKLLSLTDGAIVGCHAYGAHAADLVQEASVLMCRHTTVAQLRCMVHIHPTLSEVLLEAVSD